jgi:hypothetical protein
MKGQMHLLLRLYKTCENCMLVHVHHKRPATLLRLYSDFNTVCALCALDTDFSHSTLMLQVGWYRKMLHDFQEKNSVLISSDSQRAARYT